MSGIVNAGIFFGLSSLVICFSVLIFDILTKYKIWSEIKNGNMAVAFSTGGYILGIATIMKSAIATNDNVLYALLWGGIGCASLIIVYFAFELLTPNIKVSDEIANGNKAIGFISFMYSLAFSLIIAACIS